MAPKAKAKSKAKSFCKRPATKASLKRPAAAVAPWGVRHPRVPQLVSVKSTARHLRDVVSAQKERQSLRARLRLRPHLRVRPGVEPFWQWCPRRCSCSLRTAAPSAGTQTVPFPAGDHAASSQRRLSIVQKTTQGLYHLELKKYAACTCWFFGRFKNMLRVYGFHVEDTMCNKVHT